MKIGRHVSLNSYKHDLPVDCIQVFTKSPQVYHQFGNDHPRDFGTLHVVSHCGYLVHLKHGPGSNSARGLLHEAERCSKIGIPALVCHLSSGPLAPQLELINSLADRWPPDVKLLVENNCREPWQEALDLADMVGAGLCFDTCHAWAAGCPMDEWPTDCHVYHVNGSEFKFGARRDRHSTLASGTIPYDELVGFLRQCDNNALLILETPVVGIMAFNELVTLREVLS